MDLSLVDVRAASEAGSLLHLRDPFTKRPGGGKPLHAEDGRPVTFRVLGNEARAVVEARAEIERRKLRGEAVTNADRIRAVAQAAVIDYDGFTANGQPLPYSAEIKDRILANAESFQIQVLAHMADLGNVRPTAGKD